ncbi:hypothetical protein K438DRAFT_1975777 [Mycena galopus ATCC 62051]|nr:hypothetical protein K438DRAFT_1975777 [Mycena galopus ATCC 62051]
MRIPVQVKGLLTELILEHALCVRVKAQTPDADAPGTTSAAIDVGQISNLVTTDLRRPTDQAIPESHRINLRGGNAQLLNGTCRNALNLVATDLRNVTNVADFLLLFYMPVTVFRRDTPYLFSRSVTCILVNHVPPDVLTFLFFFPSPSLADVCLPHDQAVRVGVQDARAPECQGPGIFLFRVGVQYDQQLYPDYNHAGYVYYFVNVNLPSSLYRLSFPFPDFTDDLVSIFSASRLLEVAGDLLKGGDFVVG